MVEYLDPEIANEGFHAEKHNPAAAWMDTPDASNEEWQPDIDPPHINDYSGFKKHKHYGKYFRPYRYVAFPAWMYHPAKDAVIVKTKEDAEKLGPDWRREPYVKKMDMTGKSLPVKSETQKLAEVVAAGLAQRQGSAPLDPSMIAGIVAAVMAALPQPAAAASQPDDLMPKEDVPAKLDPDIERKALLELAETNAVKVDGRWNNERLRKELGL